MYSKQHRGVNMLKQIFLVRHADYCGGGLDPVLSEYGKRQSLDLAKKINASLGIGDVTIWSSSANRARETAEIIKQEMQLAEMVIEGLLWSDSYHPHNFTWLKEKIDSFEGDILIIVSHAEYVREFPSMIGFRENGAGYAQGVKIEDKKCVGFG